MKGWGGGELAPHASAKAPAQSQGLLQHVQLQPSCGCLAAQTRSLSRLPHVDGDCDAHVHRVLQAVAQQLRVLLDLVLGHWDCCEFCEPDQCFVGGCGTAAPAPSRCTSAGLQPFPALYSWSRQAPLLVYRSPTPDCGSLRLAQYCMVVELKREKLHRFGGRRGGMQLKGRPRRAMPAALRLRPTSTPHHRSHQ